MNILFLTHRLPYAPDRGDRIRAYHTLRVLARSHDVHLVSLVHDDDEARQAGRLAGLAKSVRICRVRSRPAALLGGAMRIAFGQVPLTHVLLDSPELGRAIREAAAAAPPDVVLAYCSGMARLALQEPLAGTPWVLDMVDADSAKWRQLGEGSSLVAWVYRREARTLGAFEQQAIARASFTTVVNERERQILLGPDSSRIAVVPNGVDIAGFARPADRPARRPLDLVFSAVFSYQPNTDAAMWLLEHIWPAVLSRLPEARLRLVGAGPPRSLQRAAERLGSVEVTGRVPQVTPYLWDAGAAVAPLRLSRGVQNKVLEAVAAGLPVAVTTAVAEGLPPEVFDACRVADDPAAMAAAIVDLLTLGEEDRRRLVQRADLAALGWEARLAPLTALVSGAGRATP